ncbi:hypothetical protein P8452_42968 [Trifolium repens]|nr:hypothetical protein P8452_42968 [Trifolium repens]
MADDSKKPPSPSSSHTPPSSNSDTPRLPSESSLPAVRTSSLPVGGETSSASETRPPYIPRYELVMTPRGTDIYFIDHYATSSSNQKTTLKLKLAIAAAITIGVLYIGYTVYSIVHTVKKDAHKKP